MHFSKQLINPVSVLFSQNTLHSDSIAAAQLPGPAVPQPGPEKTPRARGTSPGGKIAVYSQSQASSHRRKNTPLDQSTTAADHNQPPMTARCWLRIMAPPASHR